MWSDSLIHRLVELREDGISNREIAVMLGVSEAALQAQVARLVGQGVITSRKGLLRSHPDSFVQGRERTLQDVEREVARLYTEGSPYRQIGSELGLTEHQVHNTLTGLFAAGLTKRPRHRPKDEQVRAIHSGYLAGASINQLAAEIGFTGNALRSRMRKLGLPVGREITPPASCRARRRPSRAL